MPFCTTSRKSGFKCAHLANGGGARCLVVQETIGTLGDEAEYPIAHNLQPDTADPRRVERKPLS